MSAAAIISRCISTSYAVNIPRQPQIRRFANKFEDILQGNYGQPVILPIPDEMDPSVARVVFGSKNGFSQIAITQTAIGLNVTYSPDHWQQDVKQRVEYITERVRHLFELVRCLGSVEVLFSGIMNNYQIEYSGTDSEILDLLVGKYLNRDASSDNIDLFIKTTRPVDGRFFSNMQIQNYRTWLQPMDGTIKAMPYQSAATRGIAVVHDLNDRLAFNERSHYVSDMSAAIDMVSIAPAIEAETIGYVTGGTLGA